MMCGAHLQLPKKWQHVVHVGVTQALSTVIPKFPREGKFTLNTRTVYLVEVVAAVAFLEAQQVMTSLHWGVHW
jgi:hypothetical protein